MFYVFEETVGKVGMFDMFEEMGRGRTCKACQQYGGWAGAAELMGAAHKRGNPPVLVVAAN